MKKSPDCLEFIRFEGIWIHMEIILLMEMFIESDTFKLICSSQNFVKMHGCAFQSWDR